MPTRLSVGLQTKSAYMFAGWLIHKECPTRLPVGLHTQSAYQFIRWLTHYECLHVCWLAAQRVPTRCGAADAQQAQVHCAAASWQRKRQECDESMMTGTTLLPDEQEW